MSKWKKFNHDEESTYPEVGIYITYSEMDGKNYIDRNFFGDNEWNVMHSRVLAYTIQDNLVPDMELLESQNQ